MEYEVVIDQDLVPEPEALVDAWNGDSEGTRLAVAALGVDDTSTFDSAWIELRSALAELGIVSV